MVPWARAGSPSTAAVGVPRASAPTVASPPCHCHHTDVAARVAGQGSVRAASVTLGDRAGVLEAGRGSWGPGGELGAVRGRFGVETRGTGVLAGCIGVRELWGKDGFRGCAGPRSGNWGGSGGTVGSVGEGTELGMQRTTPQLHGTLWARGPALSPPRGGSTSVPSCACTSWSPRGRGCALMGVGGAPGAAGLAVPGVPGGGGCVPAPRDMRDKELLPRLGRCAVASRSFSAPSSSGRNPPPVPGDRWSWGGMGMGGGDAGGPVSVGAALQIPFPSLP